MYLTRNTFLVKRYIDAETLKFEARSYLL